MKPFIFKHWHAWESNGKILLSNESCKSLRAFDNTDACINYLYLGVDTPAARALNSHVKATS